MNRDRTAVSCEAGKPIGGFTYKIPLEEGKIRAHIIFSDRKLDSGPLATQIHEFAAANPNFMALDLRAPGQVVVETLEFTPTLEAEGVTIVGDSVTGSASALASASAAAAPSASAAAAPSASAGAAPSASAGAAPSASAAAAPQKK